MRLVLYPLSMLYYSGVTLRNYLYDKGWLKITKVDCCVIAIGNLSSGGTGKTPLAEWLIDYLLQKNLRPAYLSRGYARRTRGFILVNPLHHSVKEVGDEALMIALRYPQIPVAVCEDRVKGAQRLLQEHTIDVIILDDAYQHRKIARDLDILVINQERPPWKDYLLPAGTLREPFKNYERADAVVITSLNENFSKERFRKRIKNKPLVFFQKTVQQIIPFSPLLPVYNLSDLQHRPVILFSGIANNKQFFDSVTQLKAHIVKHFKFRDHFTYKKKHIEFLVKRWERLKENNAFKHSPILLTTEKDWVRLINRSELVSLFREIPFYYLKSGLNCLEGNQVLQQLIERAITPALLSSSAAVRL